MKQDDTLLIQLVSEQTMQNILSVLAIKPRKVVHLVSSKVANRAQWILKAAKQACGGNLEAENVDLSEMPGIKETAEQVSQVIERAKAENMTPVVNFTGGTKLMSIGAWSAADAAKVDTVYVDTGNRLFLDGNTGPGLDKIIGQDMSFEPYKKGLTVNTIAVANGRERVTGGKKFQDFLDIASYLLQNIEDEKKTWDAFYGKRGLTPSGRQPTYAEYPQISSKPINLPIPVGELAIEINLLEKRKTQFFVPSDKATKQGIDELQTFFGGGWWEVAVAERVRKSERFRDVRWSAESGERTPTGSLEEDILAVEGVQIAYFSCKRGGAKSKLSRQLEEMKQSADRLGGRFCSRFFCLYIQPYGDYRKQLYRRAQELNIRILTREDILAQNCF